MSGELNYGIPARGKAILGDLKHLGAVVDCPLILPQMWLHGEPYNYVGCSEGFAIYKSRREIQELEGEADR